MSVISLSSNAEIQSWQLNLQNADLTVNGVTLVGNEAAAYLFGLALSGIDLCAFGSLGQDRFYRTDAVLEFPPGSGQRVSLTEISDALRYKYSIDPLVEFSSSLGLAGYNLADVNNILKSLNDEFQGRFELPLLNRSEGGAQTVYISQSNVAASFQDLLSAEGRKALADLAANVRAKLLSSTELQQKLNPLLGIGLNETVFPGATQNSTVSLNQLLEKFNEAIGGNLQTLMPDLFADGKLHFNDVNVLLAAAREAMPSQAAHLADLSLELIRFTQGSQIFTGTQALAMLTAKTLATLDSDKRTGLSISEAPVIGLDEKVFTNPLISGQKMSLGQLVEWMQQNTGYDPLAHLQPRPHRWTLQDINALIDGVNTALQPSTAISLPSFNFVNADGLAITAQQAYAYNLLRALNSAGSSSALSGVWSTYSPAANGASSTFNGTTFNLADLQSFNTAVSGNSHWTLPNAWTVNGSTRALTGESGLMADGSNAPTVFLTKSEAQAVLATMPNNSIVYGADATGDVWQLFKQFNGTVGERNYGTAGNSLKGLLEGFWIPLLDYPTNPGIGAGLNVFTSSPEVLKAGLSLLIMYGTQVGATTSFPQPLWNVFDYSPGPQFGVFGVPTNPSSFSSLPWSSQLTYQRTRLSQGQSLDAALFEYPAGSGIRLSLRELSAALAKDFRGSSSAGAHNGALSLEDWFMGYGSSYSGQDATGYPTGYADVFAAAGEYFNANGGTAAGPQVVGVGTFSDPTKATPVTEWSIKAAMLGLYWANPASSTDDYITPVVSNRYQLGAVASAAKTAGALVNGVDVQYATVTNTFTRYTAQTLDKLRGNISSAAVYPAYTDDLAELRRQIGTLSTVKAAGLDIAASTLAIRGSLQVATALQAGVLANSGILARLSFDAPIGLDEPLWQDNQGKVQTLRELLAEANLLNPVLTTLPRLGSSGLDFDGFNKLLVTARRLNPDADRQLEFVHPWFQPYSTANQTFEGANALLLRLANSLFEQVGLRTYQNQALASNQRVFADPTDTSGQRKLSIDDISQLLNRLLGVDPLPRHNTWYAQDIEQAVKDLYAGVQPAIAAPGRASSAAITAAELVSFVNALVPAHGATFGPDTFVASAALFSHTVGGVTRSRSLNDLLQAFSTQTQKDLAPRLQALGILRDGQTVQLRGLNALRSWVDAAQPGQVTSMALPAAGTPTAVDNTGDYASKLVVNSEDAWGLDALQRLMAEWALVPNVDRSQEWSRWQMRFQALLTELDDSVGGLAGLGLDTGTQAVLRSLTTSTTPPDLFPQGPAIQSWLTTLQSRLTAALAIVNQDLRNLRLATSNPGYASVRTQLVQRVATLEQQLLELQQGSSVVSRLKAAGSTLAAFQSALAAEQTGQRPDVLAWLGRFDIPASDLGKDDFRTSTGGLDAFNLTAWIAQAPAAPYTTNQSLATLTAAEAAWQTTAATWNTWFGDLLNTRIPALRTSLTTDLQLQQAYKVVDPANVAWDQAITRIQGQLTRSQSLLEAIPALRTAVMTSPDALRTALQSAQTRLGVTDILAELARHDVPATDLSNPTNILPQVRYFNLEAFWAAGSPGAAGSTGYPKQEVHVATQANSAWLTATTPVIGWLESAQTRLQGVQAQVDSAITRLTARWEEPRTTASERASLAAVIDNFRKFRTEQQTRLAAAERLLAARHDAVLFNTAVTELQATLSGPVLPTLARFSFDPASISGTGPHVRSIAGVSCPDLTAAAAAVTPTYANDSVLSNAFTAWNSTTPNWRNWINTLASRTAAVVSDLGVSLASLQLQRAQAGNTSAENQNIDDALWRVQTRLTQITAVNNSVARLQPLGNQPAAFNAAVPLEVQALARFADDLPVGQKGIPDLLTFLSYFDVDSMARGDARTTVAVSIERFDYASWLSTYPQGRTPRSTADLATAFGAWDNRTSYRTWLTEVNTNITALRAALQADRTRLYQALSADGNDDSAVQALINTVIANQQRLDTVSATLDRLRSAPDTATGFAAAVTAAKTAAGLSANTDLFGWLSGFSVPTNRLTETSLRQGAAAIASFDLAAWQQTQNGGATFSDSTIGTSSPASWAQALASINTRAAKVEEALTQAQIRTGWTSSTAANTALAAAMAATPAIVANSARASTLAMAVAEADRLQQAMTVVLRSPRIDAEGKLRSRSLEQGDDGRFYHDSQAVLLRVGRMLASLPSELTKVSPSQAVFTNPMWGNRRLSLSEIMSWCREACGFDPLTLADPANQRTSWTRAELNFLVDGINQQLRAGATNPVLTWQGTAASVLVSSATPVDGQPAAQINSAQFQGLLRAQILGSDLSQTVVETELRDELVSVINLMGQMDGADFARATQTNNAPDVLVVPNGVVDITLRHLDEPKALSTYGGLVADVTRRDAVQSAVSSLVNILQTNVDLSTDQQIKRLAAQLAQLQDSLEVNDLLAELTKSTYSTGDLTGSLSGATANQVLLTIQAKLLDLLSMLRQCRSLADVIKAVQTDSGIHLMGLLQQLGIVVDGQYASRDGLNKLLEVLRHEMPERITAGTVDALVSATEPTRSRTLTEFQADVSVIQQRENALQKLQEHLDSWTHYTTLYERRTHWTQWLAELQTLATTSRAQVGELGLDMDALIARLQADNTYTQAAANALGSYVPHLTFFTQVRWRTEQLLDHWFDLWDTLEVKRKEYMAYANNSGNGATNNSATNIATAKVQIAAIDELQAKIEAKRQATIQVNEAVNHFLTIVPPSATPAAITGEKLELLQQAVADFKQQIGGQDVMAYLHDFSVPVSAWQAHSNTATKDNYTFISLGGSAADNVANGPVRYVASLSSSVFSFEKWLNTPNPQGAAATSLSVSDTITDQYAYVTGLLTNASKTDTTLLNLGKIPSDATWAEVTQRLGTARTVARNALLQSQAQLKLDYADIGAALSGLRKVQVPGGYDGYWYQMALALQSLQSTDLPANGVTATAAVLEYPPGSGERVSLKTLLDNLQTQAAADPQRTALAQKLLDVLQDDPTTQLGTNATLLTQAKLLDTGLLSRFENTTNLSNFAGALVTAFGDAISNSQISAWGVSLFGADSRLAAAIALGNTTLTSAQWTAASRELRLIQEDLERGYAGALHGQTQTVKAAATRAVILSEALTTLDAATTFSGYAASLTTLCGGSRPFALSTTNINQWATQLFGSGSALSAAIAATGTLTSAQWQAANAELRLIQQDIAKGEGGVLYGNKQAKLAALVNEASQGGDPLAVLTNGVFSLRDLQTDGSKTIKNSLADANNLSRLHGFLQGTLLGDAQRLNVAQQVQGVLTPDAATDGLDAALTLKLQSALASLRSTYSAHNWNTTATKDMTVSLNGLFTTDELTRLRSDAVGLRAESRAINQYAAYGSGRLERAIGLAATAGQTDWLLALSELDWLLTARTFRSADQLLGELDKPAGVDDWLLAVTQGQVSDADLSIDAFAKGADTSDILVKLWADAATIYSTMSATDTRNFVNDQSIRQAAYGLDPDIAWAGRGSGYGISLTELSELAKTFAGPDSKLAYAVSNPDGSGPIKGYVFGPALTKTQMAEVLKELEGIIVGGLRQQQVNASLTQALNDVANNTRLPDAPLRLASVFAGVVDMNTLDWAKRQTLLSAIRQALPSVDAALQSWAEPEPDNAGQRMALTVAQRIREWKAAYEETASRNFMATATSLELRNSLTEGADIYVDRHGTYYIDGMRTRAMDVAVMTRAVAHTSFAAEYKELMDAMAERNALIAAANSYVNNVNNVTATATATSSTPRAYAAYQVWQLLDSSTFTGAANDTVRKDLLKAKLLEVQPASGSTDLLFDITSGRVTLSTFDASLYVTSTANTVANGVQFSSVKEAISEFIKFENLLEPLRKQSNNVTSGDILSDMTGGSYSLKGSNVPLNKSAERIWTFLHTQPSGGGGSAANFTTVLAEESARNGGIDILSAVTGGDYTSVNWNNNWGTGQMANIKGKVTDFITKTPGRAPYFTSDIEKLTNLFNTLISNKVRDNDLDQGKLQSITSQIQVNTEAMTALIKAFNELNSALAQALK